VLTSVCPNCGSGKVEPNQDDPAIPYRCAECATTFVRPLVVDVDLGIDSAQQVAEAVATQLFRELYTTSAQPLALAAVNSGLVALKDTKAVALLARAGCIGAHKAMLEEAERIGRSRQKRDPSEPAGN